MTPPTAGAGPGLQRSWAGSRSTASFRSRLAATIDWYKANEDWWRPQKSATEARYASAERVL